MFRDCWVMGGRYCISEQSPVYSLLIERTFDWISAENCRTPAEYLQSFLHLCLTHSGLRCLERSGSVWAGPGWTRGPSRGASTSEGPEWRDLIGVSAASHPKSIFWQGQRRWKHWEAVTVRSVCLYVFHLNLLERVQGGLWHLCSYENSFSLQRDSLLSFSLCGEMCFCVFMHSICVVLVLYFVLLARWQKKICHNSKTNQSCIT